MQTIDAEQVFRCGFRLEQVAEDVRTAAARTSHAYPDDWRGDAGIAYQQRLDVTADRVRRMSVAYDAAGSTLIQYARAALEAQEIWRQSESLLAEADATDRIAAALAAAEGVARLAGPTRSEALRATAYRLQAEAADVEHRAAVVCAGNLDDEAQRAPATSGWRSVDRFIGDVAVTGAGMLAGTATLLKDAWQSLPGIGGRHSRHKARHELASSAVTALSLWQIPLAIRDALGDGRAGVATAEVLSIATPVKIGRFGKTCLRDVAVAEERAYRDADVQARLAAASPRSITAKQLASGGFDPLNEELRGGHTLREHVNRPTSYLRYRNAVGEDVASSFVDEASASRLVNQLLEFHLTDLEAMYAPGGPNRVAVHATFGHVTGYYTKVGSAATFPAHGVLAVVVMKKGDPVVLTAFPTP